MKSSNVRQCSWTFFQVYKRLLFCNLTSGFDSRFYDRDLIFSWKKFVEEYEILPLLQESVQKYPAFLQSSLTYNYTLHFRMRRLHIGSFTISDIIRIATICNAKISLILNCPNSRVANRYSSVRFLGFNSRGKLLLAI